MARRRRDKRMNSYPFVVDDATREALGPAGLADLAANLWPHECQTCGEALAGTRAAVHVRVGDSVASATLHHPDCQPARWDTAPTTPAPEAATVNFVSRALQLPTIGERSGAEVWRPFLLVNPGLEQVILVEHEGGWRVATTDYYAQYGLKSGGAMLRIDASVPNAIASLDDSGVVTVLLGDMRAGWAADCDPEVADRVRDFGGIALIVSTAIHPDHDLLDLVHEFADAISSERAAGGWVPLTR